MSNQDRQKWDAKYASSADDWNEPSPVVLRLAQFLPRAGRAIDVAGGTGRHAVWMAERGLDVCLADISVVALDLGKRRAVAAGVALDTIETDLEENTFPSGPWHVILCHHYLWRPLFPVFTNSLALHGRLVVIQPTVVNLQRHEKPSRPYLLETEELRQLADDLHVLHYEEGWLEGGWHEAVLVAERTHPLKAGEQL